MPKKVVVVGSGSAALSAGIAALEKGANVVIYEKADKKINMIQIREPTKFEDITSLKNKLNLKKSTLKNNNI